MPFKNSAQQRVCVGKSMDDISAGRRPKWNCEKYMCEGGSQSPTCKRIRSGGAIGSKIHQGPRGGYYFLIEGKKYYIPQRNQKAMIAKFGVEKKPVRLSAYRGTTKKVSSVKSRKNAGRKGVKVGKKKVGRRRKSV